MFEHEREHRHKGSPGTRDRTTPTTAKMPSYPILGKDAHLPTPVAPCCFAGHPHSLIVISQATTPEERKKYVADRGITCHKCIAHIMTAPDVPVPVPVSGVSGVSGAPGANAR